MATTLSFPTTFDSSHLTTGLNSALKPPLEHLRATKVTYKLTVTFFTHNKASTTLSTEVIQSAATGKSISSIDGIDSYVKELIKKRPACTSAIASIFAKIVWSASSLKTSQTEVIIATPSQIL